MKRKISFPQVIYTGGLLDWNMFFDARSYALYNEKLIKVCIFNI